MSNAFARPLIAYWSKLRTTIHPDDDLVCSQAPQAFNFDFPPPAFVGDVARADLFIRKFLSREVTDWLTR